MYTCLEKKSKKKKVNALVIYLNRGKGEDMADCLFPCVCVCKTCTNVVLVVMTVVVVGLVVI